MSPWPIDLNGYQGLALFGTPAGLGLAAAAERDDLNDHFRIAAAVLTGSGAVCLFIGVMLPLRRRWRYLRDLQLNRIVSIPARAPLQDGHETVVWHDPAHPADHKRMVVALHHALRWNVPLPAAQVPGPHPPAIRR